MAKKPTGFRRLTRVELEKLGLAANARRYVDDALKRVTKRSKLYTYTAVTKLKTGLTPRQRAAANKTQSILHGNLNGYSAREITVLAKKKRDGFDALNDNEKKLFRKTFLIHGQERVLETLGSPPTAVRSTNRNSKQYIMRQADRRARRESRAPI